jgi:hypothetical protein
MSEKCNGCHSCEGLTPEQVQERLRVHELTDKINGFLEELQENCPEKMEEIVKRWQGFAGAEIQGEPTLKEIEAFVAKVEADMEELRKV